MSSRLNELRRQRALVQEHLAWLDREIAAETDKALQGSVPASESARAPVAAASLSSVNPTTAEPVTTSTPAEDPDAILAQYRTPADSVRTDVRKGCFLYFALALVGLFALVAILYVTLSRR